MRNRKTLCAVAIGSAFFASAAQAALVVTTDSQTNNTNTLPHSYVPSSSDLINGLTPSASAGNFGAETTGGLPVLTNGVFPSPISRAPVLPGEPSAGDPFQFGAFATGGNGAGTSVTYTLPAGSPSGYNVSSIVTYGGWQDGGRDEQSYDVYYSTAAAPGTFVLLGQVDFNPGDSTGNPQVSRVTLTDSLGNLATGVAALRFDFTATENSYSGYAEFDVFGSPVPEPASLGLLCLGGLGLLARRRRA